MTDLTAILYWERLHVSGNNGASTSAAPKRPVGRKQQRRKENRQVAYARVPVLISTDEMAANGEAPIAGVLTDISPQGIGLISNRSITSGCKVKLVIHAANTARQALEALALWCNPLPISNHIIKSDGSEFWRVGLTIDGKASVNGDDFVASFLRTLQRAS